MSDADNRSPSPSFPSSSSSHQPHYQHHSTSSAVESPTDSTFPPISKSPKQYDHSSNSTRRDSNHSHFHQEPDNTLPYPEDHSNDNSDRSLRSSFFDRLNHLTFPISYTTSAVLRRLSEDSAPTPLARALSANYNGLMRENAPVFNPPTRRHSPFQPPPLTPLTLQGYKDSTGYKGRLLSKALAEEIRLLVPPRLQLVDTWKLGYSLEQDGSSLRSLFGAVDSYRGKRGGFVLMIRDGRHGVFGAYLSDPPHPNAHYYGTGECFLWRASPLPALPDLSSLPPPPSADTTHMTRSTTIGAFSKNSSSASLASLNPSSATNGKSKTNGTSTPERIRFKAFPYTGENDFTILCQAGFLSVGGGDGKYGLWLDDSLAKGVSSPCPTFGNESLSDEGEKFHVLGVEIWYLGA